MNKKGLWLNITKWNLNELFICESISPISFYENRNFGNRVEREQGRDEADTYLRLKNESSNADIQLYIDKSLLDRKFLIETKGTKIIPNKRKQSVNDGFRYLNTIYLRKRCFAIYFKKQQLMDEFINNCLLLLEVKAIHKYTIEKEVYFKLLNYKEKEEIIIEHNETLFNVKEGLDCKDYQLGPFSDKAINHIKGAIYGYLSGHMYSFELNDQSLLNSMINLKNIFGGERTKLALDENYDSKWLNRIKNEIESVREKDEKDSVSDKFFFTILNDRVDEISKLEELKINTMNSHNSTSSISSRKKLNQKLEIYKDQIFLCNDKINAKKIELEQIKSMEKERGVKEGKTRKYFSKGTTEYERKKELKKDIDSIEHDDNYITLKVQIKETKEEIKEYSYDYSVFENSISEQFNRMLDSLNDQIRGIKKNFLENRNVSTKISVPITLTIDFEKLVNHYKNDNQRYCSFIIELGNEISKDLDKSEIYFIEIVLNAIFSLPQGHIGSISNEKILMLIAMIGKELNQETDEYRVLKEYYKYRMNMEQKFTFPNDGIIRDFLVFLMKINGHEQINRMMNNRRIIRKEIVFLFWGAFIGFANLPKTFTNSVLESNNSNLLDEIDNYMFNNFILK
jgi:hypothetical protein